MRNRRATTGEAAGKPPGDQAWTIGGGHAREERRRTLGRRLFKAATRCRVRTPAAGSAESKSDSLERFGRSGVPGIESQVGRYSGAVAVADRTGEHAARNFGIGEIAPLPQRRCEFGDGGDPVADRAASDAEEARQFLGRGAQQAVIMGKLAVSRLAGGRASKVAHLPILYP